MAGEFTSSRRLRVRLCARARRAFLPALIGLAFVLAGWSLARAAGVKGEASASVSDGYARIVLKLAEEVESEVKVAGGIIIVSFKRPVDVAVNQIAKSAAGYVGSARRDPDGMGVRIALARKVTVNSMAAGEQIFIDLLPENWTGIAPGLPKEVIEDLARRAREAEKQLRQQRQLAQKKKPLVKVRVATQPTFTRYVFQLQELVPVTSDRGKDSLTLAFASPLGFDLTDAKMTLPAVVTAIDAQAEQDGAIVRFSLSGMADVRSFREDNNYVVDIGASDAKEPTIELPGKAAEVSPEAKGGLLPGVEAPQTMPAKIPVSPDAKPAVAPAPRSEDTAPKSAPKEAQKPEPKQEPKPESKAAAKAESKPNDKPEKLAQTPPREQPSAVAPRAEKTETRVSLPPSVEPAKATNFPPAQSFESWPSAEKLAPPAPPPAPAAALAAAPAPAPKAEAQKQAAPDVARPRAAKDGVAVELSRQGDNLRLNFAFAAPTPAAMFRRADSLWLVFDSSEPIDLSVLDGDTSRTIRSAAVTDMGGTKIVRLALARPRLVSVTANGPAWTVTIGDAVTEPAKALGIARSVAGVARASVTIPFEEPKNLHRIADPEIGDSLLVVTALAPARGFVKPQDFVEFRALASTQGVVLQPLADDVTAEFSADKIVVGRPGGLTLSSAAPSARNSAAYRPLIFDAGLWGFDRESKFTERQYHLIGAAADAAEARRAPPRRDLARFYLARDMFAEAKAVLDVTLADDRPTAEDPTALVLRAIASLMLNRPDEALKDLADPLIGNQHDAPLWRAFAHARQGKWAEAQQGFKAVEATIATLPIELQRLALKEALRAAIEVKDYDGAANELHEFETVGMPREMQPALLVLIGRLAQGLGRNEEALKNFRSAADSANRPAAAEGHLREVALRYSLGDLKRVDVISEFETLTTLWRGDETEIEALQHLARLYTEEGRYRDAFQVMRTALVAHPNSETTRRIHDEAATTFDSLFLAGKGDALPAIDALSLFYDFRELTPIGRRGDEMIRRLADRLVSVDLLYQAAELLQHQIDHRLQGAARAQVATRLAVIYLMDRKPDRAQGVLKATRIADLSTDLRNLRLLLEARALSDLGRYDLALEAVANIERREAIRLRSDILWAAKRFGAAAEQLELLQGERWQDFNPLADIERADILRAAIGYALAGDSIGLGRLRERYAGKMAESDARRAFEIATSPIGGNMAEFREIAKMVAATDTLDGFLREMRASYPEIGALSSADTGPKSAGPTGNDAGTSEAAPAAAILPAKKTRAAAR